MSSTPADAPSSPGPLGFVSHPYHRGGVTRWMVDAFGEWRRRGQPAWFVTPTPQSPFPSGGGRPTVARLLAETREAGSSSVITPVATSLFELGTSAFRASEYARAITAGVPPGVPLVVSDDPDVWAGAALVSHRYPIIGVLHADDEAYYSLARAYGHRLAAAVAVSGRIASHAAPILAEHGTSVARIPCGVLLHPVSDEQGLPRAGARLVWIGRIEERQKRVSDLGRIGLALIQRGVQFTLSIVGDGPEAPALRRSVVKYGLQRHVRFHGWLASEHVHSLLQESDVLLLPSNFEGMPVVAMEAMAAGCAVVASRVSGLEDYENAPVAHDALFLYDVGDVASAVQAAVRAISSPLPARRAAARAFAENEFSIGRCMDRYAELLPALRSRESDSLVQPGIARRALTVAGATGVAAARVVKRLLPS